ncbi:hypothetical protein VPHK436_0035 [Vibrio phage K436]
MEVDVYPSHINKVDKHGFTQQLGWCVKVLDQNKGIAFFTHLTKPTSRMIRQVTKEAKHGFKRNHKCT